MPRLATFIIALIFSSVKSYAGDSSRWHPAAIYFQLGTPIPVPSIGSISVSKSANLVFMNGVLFRGGYNSVFYIPDKESRAGFLGDDSREIFISAGRAWVRSNWMASVSAGPAYVKYTETYDQSWEKFSGMLFSGTRLVSHNRKYELASGILSVQGSRRVAKWLSIGIESSVTINSHHTYGGAVLTFGFGRMPKKNARI